VVVVVPPPGSGVQATANSAIAAKATTSARRVVYMYLPLRSDPSPQRPDTGVCVVVAN
jgi:hypothetical protein